MRLKPGRSVVLLLTLLTAALGAGVLAAAEYDFNENVSDGHSSNNVSDSRSPNYVNMDDEFYESSNYTRDRRFYIGGGIGMSFLDINNKNDRLVRVDDDSDLAKQLFAGYSFNNNAAVEAYYADMGKSTLNRTGVPLPSYNNKTTGDLDYTAYGLSGLFFYPILSEKLRVFLNLGYSGYDAKGSDLGAFVKEDNTSGLHIGVGAEYALTDNLALRLGYTSVDKDHAQYAAANIVYYFGNAPEPEEKIESVVSPTPQQRIIELAKNVYFITDKAELTTSAKRALDEAADILNTHRNLNITIGAHTDSDASEAYNQNLSDRRARSVASYLISRGVSASRMASRGFGELRPIASNSTAEGRAQNRRVEIRAIN